MIPKIHRLVLNRKTPFIGKRSSADWATYITKKSQQLQWAVRISKHVSPLATTRNRLRRQINQWLYREHSNLMQQDCLIILRRAPQTPAQLNELFSEIKKHLFSISNT